MSVFQRLSATLGLAHGHDGSQSRRRQRADFVQQVSLLWHKAIGDLAIFQIDQGERFLARHQRRAQNGSKGKLLDAGLH